MVFPILPKAGEIITTIISKIPVIGPVVKFLTSLLDWIIKTWTGKIALAIILGLSFISIDLFLPIFFIGVILAAILHFYVFPPLKISLSFLSTFAISLGAAGFIVIFFWKRQEATLFIILLIVLIILLFLGGFL